jgi:hypothetical protein
VGGGVLGELFAFEVSAKVSLKARQRWWGRILFPKCYGL